MKPYYIIRKHMHFLAAAGDYTTTWYNQENHAMHIPNLESATMLALKLEGVVLERTGFAN